MSEQEVEALKEFVREVAGFDPYHYNDNSGVCECHFCNDFYGFGPDIKRTHDHSTDCIHRKAVDLVAQWGKRTNKKDLDSFHRKK